MKPDLKTVIKELKEETGPRLLLLFGDDLQVQEARKVVLDHLVPEAYRGFNFERFDGHTASWEQIEASIMTPPFFPGKKLLWVDNAPYFFSREQRGDVVDTIRELWRDGKKDEAVKYLVDLLVFEGWTQEQWDSMENSSSQLLLQLLDCDGVGNPDEVAALVAYCKNREVDLTERKGSESHRLATLLDRGLPEWSFLLLTAVQVDRRTRIYKRFEEIGAALYLGLERDRSGKVSREIVTEFVNQRIGQAKKTMEPQAREMILARAGNDLCTLQQEVEKLLLFVGEHPSIRATDVDAVLTDLAEGWIFDLTRAIGERDVIAALSQLARLLAQGEPPLKILGTIAAEIRRLLLAQQLLGADLGKLWKHGMTYQQFQQGILKNGTPLITRNPYADYMCFQRAERFTLTALRTFMEKLFATDYRLKSGGNQARLTLEMLILDMCLGSRNSTSVNQARTRL